MKSAYRGNREQERVFSYMRWSSEPQTWGDSERRQERMTQDWCQRNGRTLSDRRFADSGVSGWRGDNRKSGRLGELLKLVQPVMKRRAQIEAGKAVQRQLPCWLKWDKEQGKPGVAAGLAAGMRVIAITNTHPADELAHATPIVGTYEEIEHLLLPREFSG